MKSSPSACSRRFIAAVFGCITALVLAMPGTSAAQDPCDLIVITPSNPGENEPFQICGPAGAQYYYSWRNDPSDPVPFSTAQCVSFPAGLAAGTYSWEHTYSIDANGNGPDASDPYYKCLIELTITETPDELTCEGAIDVRPEGDVCEGEDRTLCGPVGEGYYYSWHDENDNLVSTERCITVSRDAGCYEYELTVSDDLTGNGPSSDDPFIKCPIEICWEECEENCPRTIGFWKQQCEQRGNGSTKFDAGEMAQITSAVDGLSDFFSWANDFESFCAILDPPTPVDQREAALRQFAGTLANIATGQLGLIASNGDEITLDPNTTVTCGGEEMTIAELIDLADERFAALAGMSLDLPAVKNEYSKFNGCFDAINNGIGIGAVCDDEKGEDLRTAERSAARGLVANPNPLVNFTRIEFAVARDGDVVELAVYDVAGRQVRELVKAAQAAGPFVVDWDGRAADGSAVRSGVYFVRGTIGGQRVTGRLMVVR